MPESFILCIAIGGLNDIIGEIWRCIDYANKHKRSLIVDKICYKTDQLTEVFDFASLPVPVYPLDKIYTVHHKLISPPDFGRFLTYSDGCIKTITGPLNRCIRFDKDRSYSDDTLLIHHSCASGPIVSDRFFRCVGFTEAFVKFLRENMRNLPKIYNVSHIRHTDHKVNLDATYQYIDNLMLSSSLPLYVATDNVSVIKTLVTKHGARILYNKSVFARSPGTAGKPMHQREERFSLHNAILDLFILARGANSVLPQYIESGSTPHGYTQLAELLRSDTAFIERLLQT